MMKIQLLSARAARLGSFLTQLGWLFALPALLGNLPTARMVKRLARTVLLADSPLMVKGAKIARMVRQTRITPRKRRVLAAVLARSPRPPLRASLVPRASLLKPRADHAPIAQRDSHPARERRVARCVKLAPIRAARAQ